MDKGKISQKHKESSLKKEKLRIEDFAGVTEYSPTDRILDKAFVGEAVMECLCNNDPEGVMEILDTYLDTLNKTQAAKEHKIARSTLYHAKKQRNPTIRTLAKLFYTGTHSKKALQSA